MLKISDITIEKIKNNKLTKELPEFYELENVIENNLWHTNDSTFNHTLVVLKKLEILVSHVNKKIKLYLNKKVDNYTRKDLLFLATLFHDIAKKEACVKDGMSTSFLKHEELGHSKAKNILNRFDLSKKEKEIVLRIVKNHGMIHSFLDLETNELGKKFEKYMKDYKDIFLELILLSLADTLGCQLKSNNPKNFKFRIKFFQNIIKKY